MHEITMNGDRSYESGVDWVSYVRGVEEVKWKEKVLLYYNLKHKNNQIKK